MKVCREWKQHDISQKHIFISTWIWEAKYVDDFLVILQHHLPPSHFFIPRKQIKHSELKAQDFEGFGVYSFFFIRNKIWCRSDG